MPETRREHEEPVRTDQRPKSEGSAGIICPEEAGKPWPPKTSIYRGSSAGQSKPQYDLVGRGQRSIIITNSPSQQAQKTFIMAIMQPIVGT